MDANTQSSDPLHRAMGFVREVECCRRQLGEALDELDRESLVYYDGLNRRAEARYCFREPAPVGLIVRSDGEGTTAWPVFLRNLSRSGASFIHLRDERADSRAFLTIPVSECQSVRIEGTLVRCRAVLGKFFEAGIRFVAPLNLEDMLSSGWLKANSACLVSGDAPTR